LPGVTATDATGAGAGAAVLPVAAFERPPNTAFTLSVPRNAIRWKPYAVVRDSPRTVHVRLAPIALPASGVAQVPRATAGAEPHDSGLTAKRTSSLDGLPVTSLTSVTVRYSEVSDSMVTAGNSMAS